METREPAQLDLFTGAPSEPPAGRARKDEPTGPALQPEEIRELGARLPAGVYLGTSSWTFPGWKGLVYDKDASMSRLSKDALAAYAKHPVLRSVGVDRTFYAPVAASTFAEYAAQVPEGFRFLVKAHEACTLSRYPAHERYGAWRGKPNDRFLDAGYARDAVVGPMVEGLGTRAGPLVFQFPPQDVQALGGAGRFAERLHGFLSGLSGEPGDGSASCINSTKMSSRVAPDTSTLSTWPRRASSLTTWSTWASSAFRVNSTVFCATFRRSG